MQIVLKLSLVLLVLVFSFCSKRSSELPMLLAADVDSVVKVNSKVMLQSEPRLFAINFKGDTTLVNIMRKPNLWQKKQHVSISEDTPIPKYNLRITIDTTYNFHSNGFVFEKVKYPVIKHGDIKKYKTDDKIPSVINYFDSLSHLRTLNVSAFPVLVYNASKDTATIVNGNTGDFSMIQQALDTDGKWKPIEFRHGLSGCIPGWFAYRLFPNHYLGTSIIKYHGNFKTKIRVKLKSGRYNYYSNSVTAYINRSQFNQDFIENFLKERGAYEQSYFEQDKQRMLLNFSN